MPKTKRQFTALYRKAGSTYLGWVQEIPGVNTQGQTLREVKANLKEALQLVLETTATVSGRDDDGVIRESVAVTI